MTLHIILGVLVAFAVALVVGWTLALATGDAEELADSLCRLVPGDLWRRP